MGTMGTMGTNTRIILQFFPCKEKMGPALPEENSKKVVFVPMSPFRIYFLIVSPFSGKMSPKQGKMGTRRKARSKLPHLPLARDK